MDAGKNSDIEKYRDAVQGVPFSIYNMLQEKVSFWSNPYHIMA